ncbi:MAG: ABC transporter ATP-binding protein [Euryarchaeota archaeon]|nr:ABC transporter ATP-binding protein [Euryarchaeota archaeon]
MTSPSDREPPLLAVEDLETHYPITKGLLRREVGRVRAVDSMSFEINRGEAFGLVGESGSGKTTVAHSVLRLEEPTSGEIRFDGEPIGDLSKSDLRAFRRRTQLIVQNPNEAFNPRMSAGEALAEPLALHGMRGENRRRAIVADLLERVGLSATDMERYPHEFSGGEKQRLSIARALVLNPDLIVADEPTSALDGRVRADILALLESVRREFGIAILFISHDLDVVRRFCDRIAVMYLGEIVEQGPIDRILDAPAHPYTKLLLGSVPSLDPRNREFVEPLTNSVPDPSDPPEGCRFHTRCPEIIPPKNVEVPRDRWRALAAFRFALEASELPDGIEVGESSVDEIRELFGLAEISEEHVKRGVSEAIEALVRGDRREACEVLAETVPSVCEREKPDEIERDGCRVACHRYDPAVVGEPVAPR